MKSAIYLGKGQIEIRDVPVPEVGDNDVLIKNIYSSICGTDVAVYTKGPNLGHRVTSGEEFGHETVSRVVSVGRAVKDFRVGERVYPYPLFAKDDPSRAGTIGGFSEYILIPNARKNHSLFDVPDSISDRLASLTEPFTVGCRAARRGMIPAGGGAYVAGQSAVVFGAGTIGLAAATAFSYFGMRRVLVCDLSDFRLGLARALGFETCNTGRDDFASRAKDIFGAAHALSGEAPDIDCFLDATGAESVLNTFFEHGKIGSRIVCVGVNGKMRNIDLLHLMYAQKAIIGTGGYAIEDVHDVQRIMTCGRWDLESIITDEYPLDELEKALQKASDTEHSGNIVIRMPD